jgi:outer membrane lipoprotein-sorting protein
MRRVLRSSLSAIFFATVISVVSVERASGQNILGEILRRMDTYNKTLQSLSAGVTMVKHNPQLNVSDTSVGTTSYLPKTAKRVMYVRVDWTKPVVEQMSVIGDDYELYRPRLNQVIVGKVKKAQGRQGIGNALGFMNMSRDELRANYKIDYVGEEQITGGIKTWHLQLTPKTATSYKMADLWVDGDGIPRQARITENNNDTTTVLLSDIRRNETLKAEIFKLKYPSSAKKIKA